MNRDSVSPFMEIASLGMFSQETGMSGCLLQFNLNWLFSSNGLRSALCVAPC